MNPALCSRLMMVALIFASSGAAQSPLDEEFFDFTRVEPVKESAEPKTALPAEAAAMQEKLAQYERDKRAELLARIRQKRAALAEKLKAAADKAEATMVEEFLKAADLCSTHPPEKRLAHPGGAPTAQRLTGTWTHEGGKDPCVIETDGRLTIGGQQRGHWNWLDAETGLLIADWWGSNNIDFVRLTGTATSDWLNNQGDPLSKRILHSPAAKDGDPQLVLAAQAREEHLWKEALAAELKVKRAQVHDWLVANYRKFPGEAGNAMLKEAAAMEKPAAHAPREKHQRASGVWVSGKGARYEFLPDGEVRLDGRAAGRWGWAKARNWKTLLVTMGEGKTRQFVFARLANSESGVMRTYSLDGAPGDLKKQ